MKIGLLGGSFNPPHKGHIHISLACCKPLKLNQIWWIPARKNPLKATTGREPIENRIKKCQEITKNYPQITVKSPKNKTVSIYTIDLLKNLVRQYPNYQFYWIMGADNIINFHQWKNWKQIIKLTPLIICDRNNYFYKAVKSRAFLFARKLNRVKFLKIRKAAESSTNIRKQNEL
jgi:nicotinate-nucleotide adenylyltransferase